MMFKNPMSIMIYPVKIPGTMHENIPNDANIIPSITINQERLNSPSGVSPKTIIWMALITSSRPSSPSVENGIIPITTGKRTNPSKVIRVPNIIIVASEIGRDASWSNLKRLFELLLFEFSLSNVGFLISSERYLLKPTEYTKQGRRY